MQKGLLMAYISKTLALRHKKLSVYKRELFAILYAIKRWHYHLINGHFIIKTDHQSLKFLLEQRLNTPLQCCWLTKLMGCDFDISYKHGKENILTDALSRITSPELSTLVVSSISTDLYDHIKVLWTTDSKLAVIIQGIQEGAAPQDKYTFINGQLQRKGKLVVGNDPQLQTEIIQLHHASAMGSHSGDEATQRHVSFLFYWKRAYANKCTN